MAILENQEEDKESTSSKCLELSKRSLVCSTLNRFRFPIAQFGHYLSSIDSASPFLLQDFGHVLHRMTLLETYCQAVDSNPYRSEDNNSSLDSGEDVDLFQAIFYPRCLAPRTSMNSKQDVMMTETSISQMWFRLVSYYFEWISGIAELAYMADSDKIHLTVCQLCKLICFTVAYFNYSSKSRGEEDDILLFGSGYYWDPARNGDVLMDEYCTKMLAIVNTYVIPRCEEIKMTKEEYTILKLIAFYDCSDVCGMSPEGVEFTRSMCNKYRTILSQYTRYCIQKNDQHGELSEVEINRLSLERVCALLSVPTLVEKMGKVDDDGLAYMVENNYGKMCGRLQKQIHTESKKNRYL